VILFGALATFTFGFKASGFGDGSGAPAGSDSAVGEALQKQYFQGQSGDRTEVIFKYTQSVWDDPAVLAATQQQLAAQTSVFTAVSGPLQLGTRALPPAALTAIHAGQPVPGLNPVAQKSIEQALSHTISKDGHTVIFAASLAAGDSSSSAALNATPQVREAVSTVASSVKAADSGVLGQSTALYDVSHISTSDLQKVIPIAIVVIGLLLVIVMRSLVSPIYLIVSVGLSYLAALGTAVLIFITIGGAPGLVFFLPFMMFIFLLALGEDYNILVMTRIREEAHHKPLKEAVRDALNATGTTVTSAGLVLAATFAVFAVVGGSGGGSQIRDLGVGMVVGILMDTFLVRTLLVPSTVILLGKWNWWPSKFSHDHQNELTVPSGAEFAD
jgi:RND superfamily putative drug exporter